MLSFFSLVTRSGTFWSEYPHHCYSSASDCPLRQRFKIMSIIGHLNQTSDKLFEWKFHFSTKSASSFVAKRNISVLMSQRRKAKRFLTCRNNCKKKQFFRILLFIVFAQFCLSTFLRSAILQSAWKLEKNLLSAYYEWATNVLMRISFKNFIFFIWISLKNQSLTSFFCWLN